MSCRSSSSEEGNKFKILNFQMTQNSLFARFQRISSEKFRTFRRCGSAEAEVLRILVLEPFSHTVEDGELERGKTFSVRQPHQGSGEESTMIFLPPRWDAITAVSLQISFIEVSHT